MERGSADIVKFTSNKRIRNFLLSQISPFVIGVAVGLLFSVGLLRLNVSCVGRSLVGSLRCINTEMSLWAIDIEVSSGTFGLSNSLRGVEIDIWSLVDLFDPGSFIVGSWFGYLSCTSAKANLGTLVGKLRSNMVNMGSFEIHAEFWAINSELTSTGSGCEARAIDTKRSLGSIDTEVGFWAIDTVVNRGSLVRERPI